MVRGLVLRQPSLLARASEGLQSKVKEYADIFEDEVGLVSKLLDGWGFSFRRASGAGSTQAEAERPLLQSLPGLPGGARLRLCGVLCWAGEPSSTVLSSTGCVCCGTVSGCQLCPAHMSR